MILVDTSVWIGMLRRRQPLDLESLVAFDEIVLCLPVVQEVLQGIREERPYREVREALLGFPVVESPVPRAVFLEAATLFRTARRHGLTVRSGVDCLIAACALRSDLEVLHADRDFDLLAKVSDLRARRVA